MLSLVIVSYEKTMCSFNWYNSDTSTEPREEIDTPEFPYDLKKVGDSWFTKTHVE